jgi:hypothetical protein
MFGSRLIGAAAAALLTTFAVPIGGVAFGATTTPAGTYAVYCSAATANAFTGCYVDGASSPLSVPSGSTITADPVVPPTATAATGLTAPDGILGAVPVADVPSGLGIPSGATTILYVDKQVGYFIPGTTTATLTLPITTPTSVTVTGDYSGFGAGTYYVASNSDVNSGPSSLNCTGAVFNSGTGNTTLQACTSSNTDSIPAGNDVGAPGSCITSGAVLQEIGEGSTKGKTLFKNNEDFASVRMAYTTDGVNFTDVTPNSGITGLGSPTAQTGFRWISPGGSVIQNSDGSLGLFYSEGQCTDGDSDAFGSMEYSTSTNGGLSWTAGTQIPDGDAASATTGTGLLSTDYTFGASIANQPANNPTNKPLDVSAYYDGRIYSPSVVQNGDGTLTMTFSGYRTSKPLPATGSGVLPIGRASENSTAPATNKYTPAPTDPALYRNILTVQLTMVAGTGTNPTSNPAKYTAGTPVVAQVQGGPWTTAQGDPGASGTEAPYSPNGGSVGATFAPGGGPTNTFGGTAYPNLATYPGSGATGTAIPYTTGYSGTPGPLAGYCGTGGTGGTGNPAVEPAGLEPMSPYYFPHIEAGAGGTLTGYFDYRPKDTDEALVVATSSDKGQTWTFQTKALELTANHCPNGNSDMALQTTTDDGEGHANDLTVNGTHYLYTVNRSNGVLDTVGSQFLVHALSGTTSLGLPATEPVGTGASTASTGANTITNTPGGVSTSTFTVNSTAGFNEIPGRIYVTPISSVVPESPFAVALPISVAAVLGLGYLVLRRKRSRVTA